VLELSGIGDPGVLRNASVEVVVDLRGVGNNVQEHYNVGVSYRGSISSCFVTMTLRSQSRGEGRVRIRVLVIGLSARSG
jgi:choline dehydrogenase-like flavoprotein